MQVFQQEAIYIVTLNVNEVQRFIAIFLDSCSYDYSSRVKSVPNTFVVCTFNHYFIEHTILKAYAVYDRQFIFFPFLEFVNLSTSIRLLYNLKRSYRWSKDTGNARRTVEIVENTARTILVTFQHTWCSLKMLCERRTSVIPTYIAVQRLSHCTKNISEKIWD